METIKISVGDLVKFIHASGDLESKNKAHEARKRGLLLHEERQETYQPTDQKEVHITFEHQTDAYRFKLQGRIDGLREIDGVKTIEEIKSTETSLALIEEQTFPAHLMQAKVYGHMLCQQDNLAGIQVQLVYVHYPTRDIKTFVRYYPAAQLAKGFAETIDAYMAWLDIYQQHVYDRQKTIEGLSFPYPSFREGQHPFMAAVYQTFMTEDILYATAPTGIGKTVAALYSALKTVKDDNEKIFYLTAKNAAKSVAVETVELMKAKGLKIKALTLNAKDNMCLRDEVDCDPEICPFAKGFYNRLKIALQDIFVHDDVYDIDLIKQYATYHNICPHEFALEIALYADVVICDYNYVFDPRIRLMRFFEENDYHVKLLIDEAHNMVDRSKAMYSAQLDDEALHNVIEALAGKPANVVKSFKALAKTMTTLITETEIKKRLFHADESLNQTLYNRVYHTLMQCDQFLQEHKKHPKRKTIREYYFSLLQFVRIAEFYGPSFRFIIEHNQGVTTFNIVCFDASKMILDTLKSSANGSVFFSATLKPNQYYAALISRKTGKSFEVPSPFPVENLGLFVDVSTSTKFHERKHSITRIIDSIYALLESKKGNYIVYFPSYQYMKMVTDMFDGSDYEVLIQSRRQSFFERRDLMTAFKAKSDTSKVLFSVLGGSFSEGIDLVGDALSGVLIVGVALPAFNKINDLMRQYYDDIGYDGFHFAYTYPGMNKVIQAVGRVIRSVEDKGVAVLIDQRYQRDIYQQLMPKHWSHAHRLDMDDYLQGFLDQFWKKTS